MKVAALRPQEVAQLNGDQGDGHDQPSTAGGRQVARQRRRLSRRTAMTAPPPRPRRWWQRPELVFYPFFLEGVAGDPALNQPDGIHPNERGVAEILRRMLPAVEALLQRVPHPPAG